MVLIARPAAQEPERVGTDFAGRGREGAEEHLVVERVRDHREQADHVLDLLLGPVASAAHYIRLEARAPQRVLVYVDVGERP